VRINADVEQTELENDEGYPVDGLTITCSRCGHRVEVFGTSGASARRGAIMLREECPEGGGNFYAVSWED
jgi:hypothetical protein